MHRNLKSSNLMLDEEKVVKVSDYLPLDPFDEGSSNCNLADGRFSAPEVMRGDPYHPPADVFSYGMLHPPPPPNLPGLNNQHQGMVMFEVIFREDPPDRSDMEGYAFPSEDFESVVPEDIPDDLWELCLSCEFNFLLLGESMQLLTHCVGIAQRPEDRYEFGKIASATEKIYNRIPGQADWLYDEQMSFIEEKKPPKQRKEEEKKVKQEDWNLLRTEERRHLMLIDELQEDLQNQLMEDLKDEDEKQKEENYSNHEPSLPKPQQDSQVKVGSIEVKREWQPYSAKEAQGSQSKRRMTDSRPRKESLAAHAAVGRPDSPGAPSIKTLRSPAPLKAESANSVECVIS